jgi:hypothetical protein
MPLLRTLRIDKEKPTSGDPDPLLEPSNLVRQELRQKNGAPTLLGSSEEFFYFSMT